MNYSRRPNRPDANVYRQMRRGGMRRTRPGGAPINPKVLLVATVMVVILVAWLMWN